MMDDNDDDLGIWDLAAAPQLNYPSPNFNAQRTLAPVPHSSWPQRGSIETSRDLCCTIPAVFFFYSRENEGATKSWSAIGHDNHF